MNGIPGLRVTAREGRRRRRDAATLALLLGLAAVLACCLAGMLAAPPAQAASGDLLWRRIYAGLNQKYDAASKLALTRDGSAVYVTGYVTPPGSMRYDLGLTKYSSSGRRLWTRSVDGAAHLGDEGLALAIDAHGNVYVGGSTEVTLSNGNFLVAKYSASGKRLWKRTWGGSAGANDTFQDLALDANGNVYVVGWSDSGPNEWDGVLVKWTRVGRRAWVRTYDGAFHGYDQFRRVIVDRAHGYVYVGGSTEVADADYGWLLARYSLSGIRAWANTPGAADMIGGTSTIALTGSGAIVQGGSGSVKHYVATDAKVVLWTPGGAVDWTGTYVGAGGSYDHVNDLALARDGSIVAVGQDGGSEGQVEGFIARYSATGVPLGSVTSGTPGADDPWIAVACGGAGDIYVIAARGATLWQRDYVTVKYNSTLKVRWTKQTGVSSDDSFDDTPSDLAVRTGTRAGVYVTGRGQRSSGESVWYTVKYRP